MQIGPDLIRKRTLANKSVKQNIFVVVSTLNILLNSNNDDNENVYTVITNATQKMNKTKK